MYNIKYDFVAISSNALSVTFVFYRQTSESLRHTDYVQQYFNTDIHFIYNSY